MITAALAIIGQLLDARTTEVAIKTGSREINPLMAQLISKAGWFGFYGLKFGVPFVAALFGSVALNLIFAAVGLFCAGRNYSRLRSFGFEIREIFW